MTTFAAILAALPLMLGTGTGSELRNPLGIAIVGGLIVSQVLTLFTTPVIYLYFDRLAVRLAGGRPGSPLAAGDSAMNLRHLAFVSGSVWPIQWAVAVAANKDGCRETPRSWWQLLCAATANTGLTIRQ